MYSSILANLQPVIRGLQIRVAMRGKGNVLNKILRKINNFPLRLHELCSNRATRRLICLRSSRATSSLPPRRKKIASVSNTTRY